MDLQNVFLTVWNMSLTGSIIIGFVLLARIILRKAPKVFSYALWSVVLFRLLCPVSISSVFSVLNFMKTAEPVSQSVVTTMDYSAVEMPEFISVAENEPVIEEPIIVVPDYQEPQIEDSFIPDDGMDFIEVPDAEFPQAPAEPVRDTIHYAVIIWLVGLGVMLVYNVISCIRLFRQIEGAVPLRKELYQADYISTAFVLGIINPRIYLPSYLTPAEQGYIIAHERCHIKRMDHVFRLLAYLALCLHWFNPLVWLAFVLSGKDMEMSCDEAVIRMYGPRIRAEYSQSLLRLATGHRSFALTPLAFGEGDTKERVINMSNWKKPKTWATIIALVVCVAVLIACAVNPTEEKNPIESMNSAEETFWDRNKDVEQVCIEAIDELLDAESYYIVHENDLDQYKVATEYRRHRGDQLIRCATDSSNDRVYQNGKLGTYRSGTWVWQENDMEVDVDAWLRTWSPEFIQTESYHAGETTISFEAAWGHPYNLARHYEGTVTFTFGNDGKLEYARREAVLMEGENAISGLIDSITPVEESADDTLEAIQRVASQCITKAEWEENDPYSSFFKERKSVAVRNVDEFLAAIASDTAITMEAGTYNLSQASDYGQKTDGKYYYWEKVSDGYELVLHEIQNLVIQGLGVNATTIETDPRHADVIKMENCSDVIMHGFTAGHTRDRGDCGGDVIELVKCSNVEMYDLGLYGCGVVGLFTKEGRNITIHDSDIYDCASSAFQLEYTDGVTISDCNIYQIGANSGGGYAVFHLAGCSDMLIEDCTIYDNICQSLLVAGRTPLTMKNCLVKENRFIQGALVVQGWDVVLSHNQFRDNSIRSWYYNSAGEAIDENGTKLTEEVLEERYGQLYQTPTQKQTEVHVSTAEEFIAAIGPNKEIVIDAENLNLSKAEGYGRDSGDYYFWQSAASGGFELVIRNVDNMTIRGADGKDHHLIEAEPRHANVLAFQACSNITVAGITGGHTIEPGYCTGGVLWFRDCDHILVDGCGLFGCGTMGVETEDCEDITVKNCDIYECTECGVKMRNTKKIRLENTTFRDIGGMYTIWMINCWDAQQDGKVLIDANTMGGVHIASPDQQGRNTLEYTLMDFVYYYFYDKQEEMREYLAASYDGPGLTHNTGKSNNKAMHFEVTFNHVDIIDQEGSYTFEIPYHPYDIDDERRDEVRYLLVTVVKENDRYKISDYQLKE